MLKFKSQYFDSLNKLFSTEICSEKCHRIIQFGKLSIYIFIYRYIDRQIHI